MKKMQINCNNKIFCNQSGSARILKHEKNSATNIGLDELVSP